MRSSTLEVVADCPHRPAGHACQPACGGTRRIRGALAATALALTTALAAAQQDPLADAQKLLRQGSHAAAMARVDAHLARKPEDAQGRFLKGLILAEQDRLDEAAQVFVRLTEDYPELPEPYNNLAVLYAQQRQYDKARAALEMAIRTHPAYAVAYENLGDVYAKLASQAYDKALQIDSGNSAAQGKLSLIREIFVATPAKASATAKPAATAENRGSPRTAAHAVAPPARVAAPVADTRATGGTPPVTAAMVASPSPSAARPPASVAALAPAAPPAVPAGTPAAPPALQEITRILESWASAWSNKDVSAYLAHYGDDFSPDGVTSRKEWAANRAQRVGKPGTIEVKVADVEVSIDQSGRAVARFHQRYRSDNLNSSTYKTIVFRRDGERWVIVQERVG
jgi:tetratricopeptide (TPR) repeat protein